MSLTEELKTRANDIWNAIINHPFVVELYRGTLPIDKFRFYVVQDYNYLITLTKCQALIASKLDDPVNMRSVLELALADVSTELENYNKLLGKLGLSINNVLNAKPSPTNTAYMNFLLTTCSMGTAWEGLVAILPCYWTYLEIARFHAHELDNNPVDIYREWASVYLSNEYRLIVDRLRELIDSKDEYLRKDFNKLLSIFKQASTYEYMFWDMAYRQEAWPI